MFEVGPGSVWHSAGVSADPAVPPSGVVTFLFTDVEGSTRRWEADADGMRAALAAHDEVLEAREAVFRSMSWCGVAIVTIIAVLDGTEPSDSVDIYAHDLGVAITDDNVLVTVWTYGDTAIHLSCRGRRPTS